MITNRVQNQKSIEEKYKTKHGPLQKLELGVYMRCMRGTQLSYF